MTIASFGDSACALKLAGLKDSRVHTCKSNKRLMRGEVLDITDLGEEHSTGGITDTVNGSDNFHLLNCKGRTELREDACYLIKLLHKMKERGDLPGQNELFSEANGSDRVFSSPDNLISADRDLSTLPIALKRICNNLSFRGSDKAGRGELLKKQKHGCSKDITYGLQFRENALENPLNLVFGRSDKMRDRFPLSGNIPEVSDVLRNGELLNRILVDEDEAGDSEESFLSVLVLRKDSLAKLEINKGLMTTALISLEDRKEKRLIW